MVYLKTYNHTLIWVYTMKKSNKFNNIYIFIMFLLAFIAFLFSLFYSTFFNAMQFLFLSLCLLLPILLINMFNIKIPFYIILVYNLFLIAHFVVGEVLNFYVSVSNYDTALHFLSAICISFLGLYISNQCIKNDFFGYQIVFSFMFGLTSEFLWEILEYSIDHFCNTNMQRFIKDGLTLSGHMALYDTMKDMFVALSGCMSFVILKLLFNKKKKSRS